MGHPLQQRWANKTLSHFVSEVSDCEICKTTNKVITAERNLIRLPKLQLAMSPILLVQSCCLPWCWSLS